MYKMVCEKKSGRVWVAESECTDRAKVYEWLCRDLIAKKLYGSYSIRSIALEAFTRDTVTITVTHNNGYRTVYTLPS